MFLNENDLYKDELAKSSNSNKKLEKKEQVKLEETSDDNIIKHASTPEIGESSRSSGSSDETGDSESMCNSSSEDEIVEIETHIVRRSTRLQRPSVKYSP